MKMPAFKSGRSIKINRRKRGVTEMESARLLATLQIKSQAVLWSNLDDVVLGEFHLFGLSFNQ